MDPQECTSPDSRRGPALDPRSDPFPTGIRSTSEDTDILYNNAARFLRLSKEEMRRHSEGR
jgi:hypothetical protein